jgi:transcription initiation factor IIE alpha subunit
MNSFDLLFTKSKIMKRLILLSIVSVFISTFIFGQKAGRGDTVKHDTYYSCPTHPEVTGHAPGKCPKCGMELNLSTKEQMKAREVKNFQCPVHLDVTKHDPGKCPKCGKKLNLSPKEQMKAEVVKLYTCPMHPLVSLDKNGNCPKCGMSLVEKRTN